MSWTNTANPWPVVSPQRDAKQQLIVWGESWFSLHSEPFLNAIIKDASQMMDLKRFVYCPVCNHGTTTNCSGTLMDSATDVSKTFSTLWISKKIHCHIYPKDKLMKEESLCFHLRGMLILCLESAFKSRKKKQMLELPAITKKQTFFYIVIYIFHDDK